MPKSSHALRQLPPSTLAALSRLGADLAVARLRRKESLKIWAQRMGVSVPTLLRLEAGEPTVSLGVLATALWLVGRDSALATVAAPEDDRGALELDVRQAQALGQRRARANDAARATAQHPTVGAGNGTGTGTGTAAGINTAPPDDAP